MWSANLEVARLMTYRIDKQIIKWVENWLDYQAQSVVIISTKSKLAAGCHWSPSRISTGANMT